MEALLVAVAPWAVIAILKAEEHSVRVKRGYPGKVRDQLLPEEVEAHHDALKRRRSDEINALKATGVRR